MKPLHKLSLEESSIALQPKFIQDAKDNMRRGLFVVQQQDSTLFIAAKGNQPPHWRCARSSNGPVADA